MDSLGHEIQVARLMKGMPIERLSAYADIPVKELVLIEHDYKKANARQLFRLTTILNIPPSLLSLSMEEVESEIEAAKQLIDIPDDQNRIAEGNSRIILIIGQYLSDCRNASEQHFQVSEKVSILEAPSANLSFSMLGIGTTGGNKNLTPYLIILDTDIQNENFRQTTRAFTGVERLRNVPVFLTGTTPTDNLSKRSNVFGKVSKPQTPADCKEQISGLLTKVDMLNNYF